MKNIVQLLVLLSFGTYAQTIRPFIGTSGYVHSSFENSGFGEFKLGSEYKVFYYLKPEIEISIMLGSVEEETNRNETGTIMSVYSTKVSAVNYSFSPKFMLGNKEDGDGYICIIPKYSYATTQAKRDSSTRNPNNLSTPIEKKDKASASHHAVGIGVGYVIDLSDDNGQSLALNLYLNNINISQALNKFETEDLHNTKYVIGFGVNYYFSLKKKVI
jgi:hypothetical protein